MVNNQATLKNLKGFLEVNTVQICHMMEFLVSLKQTHLWRQYLNYVTFHVPDGRERSHSPQISSKAPYVKGTPSTPSVHQTTHKYFAEGKF